MGPGPKVFHGILGLQVVKSDPQRYMLNRSIWFNRDKRIPRKSNDQTLPVGSKESFTWIILKTILCLVLDFQGIYIYTHIGLPTFHHNFYHDMFRKIGETYRNKPSFATITGKGDNPYYTYYIYIYIYPRSTQWG